MHAEVFLNKCLLRFVANAATSDASDICYYQKLEICLLDWEKKIGTSKISYENVEE
jgi:hypothetical protein